MNSKNLIMHIGNLHQLLFFFFAIFIFSSNGYPVAPTTGGDQPGMYEFQCEIYFDEGEVERIEAYYNDDDGDCISGDWYAIHHYKDGRSESMLSDEFSADSEIRMIKFNTWGCCQLL